MLTSTTPKKMRSGGMFGGKLKALYNALVDFAVLNRPLKGPGIEINQTTLGTQLSVSKELLDLANRYAEASSGASGNDGTSGGNGAGGTGSNPFNGGGGGNNGGGTGLPDVETDPDGSNPSHDGNALAWQEIHVCVSDGNGGWTPMTMGIYGTAPY